MKSGPNPVWRGNWSALQGCLREEKAGRAEKDAGV